MKIQGITHCHDRGSGVQEQNSRFIKLNHAKLHVTHLFHIKCHQDNIETP